MSGYRDVIANDPNVQPNTPAPTPGAVDQATGGNIFTDLTGTSGGSGLGTLLLVGALALLLFSGGGGRHG